MKKLILIDGNSVANRAFYALPMLSNDKGQYTNAVYGFTTMLMKILEEEQPTHILVAFDAGKTTFRHQDYKEYKGKRQKTPSELAEQFPMIQQVLEGFSVQHYELKNYEADDIIGTLARSADQKEWSVKIITGDKDMFQLVSEHVQIAFTKKGITEVEEYDLAKLAERYQLKPEQITDLKGLMGDTSDNIPGVPGVGEKTALKLLHAYGSIPAIYEHIHEVSGKKLQEKLTEYEEQALLSKKLATIMTDAPLEISLEATKYDGYDPQTLSCVFQEYEFKSLLDRVQGQDTGQAEQESVQQEALDIVELEHSDEDLPADLFHSPAAIHVEIIDDAYHRAHIQGMAISHAHGNYFFTLETLKQSTKLQKWLQDEGQHKWVYNAKRTKIALKWQGLDINGLEFDVFLAAYLINPTASDYPLADLVSNYGTGSLPADEQIYGKGAKLKAPDDRAELVQHVAAKAHAVYQLHKPLEDQLREHDALELFYDLELPLSHILVQMEWDGITVDQDQLQEMERHLQQKIEDTEQTIYELAGHVQFNINSPKQLGEILFQKLQLPPIKKTKTGYSTSAEVLEKLAPQHEIIEHILMYRQLVKLQSTYIEALQKEIYEGKIHTNYQQTIAATGRLSSTDPNLQNIPIRLEEGRKIRKAFIPTDEQHVLLAADYSQIELRILAHLSEDSGLMEAFRTGQDVHTKTAMDVFHVSEDQVTATMRRQAKAVNFGIIYGISDFGLSTNLNISRQEAKQFIEQYFASFPGVKQYMDDIVEHAKKDGYVSTMFQRKRYLPEINSRNFNLRSFAERTAMNTPIQGTAADIIKKAMLDMCEHLERKQMSSKLLLQVHDELIFEVPLTELEEMLKLVPQVMENAVELKVPLQADVAYGASWYDTK